MKKMFSILAILLTFGLMANGTAVAQGSDSAIAPSSMEDLEGFQSGYQRSFSPDTDAVDTSEGISISDMMKGATIMVITFDSDDNAEKAMEDTVNSVEEGSGQEVDGMTMEFEDVDDIADGGVRVTSAMEMGEDSLYINVLAIRDGNTVWMVTGIDTDEEAASNLVNGIVDHILDQEIETEEVTLVEEGGSTGGVFDLMPATGDEAVGDLVNDSDMDLTNISTGQ